MKRKGFTLIELLIVIAIIGVLSAALYPTIRDALARGRDGARAGDINNLATVLETYNSDYGQYPQGDAGCFDESLGESFFSTPGTPSETLYSDYFKGGKPSTDPSPHRDLTITEPPALTGLIDCVEGGKYYYKSYNGESGVEFIIATVMESDQNNNYDGDNEFDVPGYSPGEQGKYYVHVF